MIINVNTTISDVCDNDLIVTEDAVLTINGICSKKVLIESDSKVIVKGICDKLEVLQNASAQIYGIVKHLINRGNISVSGIVENLEDLSNNTIIKPNALVNGKKY